jgi:hypothetical protein
LSVEAPGGRWTVPLTRSYLDEWYVFDNTGAIVYSTTRFRQVPGAAFSPEGDTIYAVAEVRTGDADSLRWGLVILEAASGREISMVEFGDASRLLDVLYDPFMPNLYVAAMECYRTCRYWQDHRVFLKIIDRRTLELIASIPIAQERSFPFVYGFLVHGGFSGHIHVIGVFDGLSDLAFDIMWDVTP